MRRERLERLELGVPCSASLALASVLQPGKEEQPAASVRGMAFCENSVSTEVVALQILRRRLRNGTGMALRVHWPKLLKKLHTFFQLKKGLYRRQIRD